jgi:hypothetical protein
VRIRLDSAVRSVVRHFGWSELYQQLTRRKPMRYRLSIISVLWTVVALCSAVSSHAGTNLLTTNVVASGSSWSSPAIWKTNNGAGVPIGTAVTPIAGNTYAMIANSLSISNGANNTRVRNPAVAGVQTFPGDSLTMNTNTELRAKGVGAILNFPGVGGNPGLILNGGMLNGGDDTTFGVTGRVQVAAQSYISHGANGGGGGISANRAFNFTGLLTGSGTMVILNSGLNVAQQVSNSSNTFSGQWILQCGWLRGTVTNSLGTNSLTVDPNFNGYLASMPNVTSPNGPTRLEVDYDLNSAGVLTLTNGGLMRLHQNVIFSAVNIENFSLSAGTHYFSELIASFPTSFDPTGSGSITVQPYGPPPPIGPQVGTQPLPQALYAGRTAHFSATGTGPAPLTFKWQKAGLDLSNGGNVFGATNTTLILSNVAAGDVANYTFVVSNQAGSATSIPAPLTIVALSGEPYETAVYNANPFAFYQFNTTEDPATNNALALDYAGGFLGRYGISVQNGNPNYNIAGPQTADGFPGFNAGNHAASFNAADTAAHVTLVSPWNLNTNAVTLTAWVNPSGAQNFAEGIVFCRGGDTVAGLNTSSGPDINGNAALGYTWNNEFETYTWNSGLEVPSGQWSFVALVITPTGATIHVMNTNGLVSATHTYPHVVQSFNGTTMIGDDSGGATGLRVFRGAIDDVAVFNSSLSKSQLTGLFYAASGASAYAPIIAVQPVSLTLYASQTAQFTVEAGGSDPLTYQWKAGTPGSGIYTNLNNGGRFSGATGETLSIANISDPADVADYVVTVSNGSGLVTSSVATLSISATNAPQNITSAAFQPSGASWDTLSVSVNLVTVNTWSDGNSATASAASAPGNTYELVTGPGGVPALGSALMRSPPNPRTAIFPGRQLTMDGNGVWVNGPSTNTTTITEFRFKQPTSGNVNGTVVFPKLVMNGGQLDVGNPGVVQVLGEVDILTNTPIYNDSNGDRGYEIGAWLTGSGTIEYHGYNLATFQPGFTNTLNIVGTSNTFSGKWNVVIGTLVGSAPNCLGTNDIIIGANGALETTYDVNNTSGTLFLTGRMNLHQNDTFRSVFVNGVPLSVGTYTSAQLSSLYTNNFPTNWIGQYGAANTTNAAGSLTVLVQPVPQILAQPVPVAKYPTETAQFTVTAQGNAPLVYQWRKGGVNLADGGNLSGSTTTNLTITNIVSGNAGNYDVVVTNSIGGVTSIVASLTIKLTGDATNISLNLQQPQNSDWDTLVNWDDGQGGLSATESSLKLPGSTYEVLAGARLRSPPLTTNSVFPGTVLTIDGSGVWVNNNDATIGELRFKHPNPGTVTFKKLVMNGGQLDTGDNGLITILGELNINNTNAPIYVDSAAGNDRPYQIDAKLTGSGNIEFHAFDTSFSGGLNITGTGNTYSGTWNVVQGALLGSGLTSLGTNDITVGANGALETLYNVNNTNGNLILNGQMFLHTADVFKTLTVGGVAVPPRGTPYSWAELSGAYPTNFPATWPQLLGSGVNAASGSIKVLTANTPPQVTLQLQLSGSNLQLSWSQGTLLESTNVAGPWTTNTAPSPFTVSPTNSMMFYRVQVQ